MTYIEKISFTDISACDLLPLLTERIQQAGLVNGICSIQSLCPECCILVTEPDDRAIQDILDDYTRIIPSTVDYLSDRDPRLNAAYTKCSLIGANRDIPVEDGKLLLGSHQNVYLLNLYGCGDKEIAITFIS